jgi:hypothetical protein
MPGSVHQEGSVCLPGVLFVSTGAEEAAWSNRETGFAFFDSETGVTLVGANLSTLG